MKGKGSRFFFDMDFTYGKKVSKKKKKTAADKKKRRNLSILIVDDNRVNLILKVAEILKVRINAKKPILIIVSVH